MFAMFIGFCISLLLNSSILIAVTSNQIHLLQHQLYITAQDWLPNSNNGEPCSCLQHGCLYSPPLEHVTGGTKQEHDWETAVIP